MIFGNSSFADFAVLRFCWGYLFSLCPLAQEGVFLDLPHKVAGKSDFRPHFPVVANRPIAKIHLITGRGGVGGGCRSTRYLPDECQHSRGVVLFRGEIEG